MLAARNVNLVKVRKRPRDAKHTIDAASGKLPAHHQLIQSALGTDRDWKLLAQQRARDVRVAAI